MVVIGMKDIVMVITGLFFKDLNGGRITFTIWVLQMIRKTKFYSVTIPFQIQIPEYKQIGLKKQMVVFQVGISG